MRAGSMVGKALYEGMLINVAFAPFFVSRLQVLACANRFITMHVLDIRAGLLF
jgi:hypothetical protein